MTSLPEYSQEGGEFKTRLGSASHLTMRGMLQRSVQTAAVQMRGVAAEDVKHSLCFSGWAVLSIRQDSGFVPNLSCTQRCGLSVQSERC